MDEIDDLRERVAQACRVLGTLELTKAATGHVSARLPGTNRVFIRARGPNELGVRFTTVDEIIEVDLDGRAIGAPAGLAAPNEVYIHTSLFRARPEVNGVVHIHPKTVVMFTICDLPLDDVPTYERSITIATPALGADLVRVMGSKPICLMRGHGITAANRSVEEAALDAIFLNDLATVNYEARLLGEPRPISNDVRAGFSGVESAWRYYTRLTGS